MKKLIALIGAVATAFGLYADPVEYYANSFETTAEGLSQDGTTWSAAAPWSTTLTDAFNVEAYGQGEPGVYSDVAARRTTMFPAQDTNRNVLKLETGTNTLDLAIDNVTVAPEKFYFDQLVKFTGFEEEPTFAADTKIAVWMSAIEQEGTPAVPAQGEPQIDNGEGEMVDNPDYVPAVEASDDYVQGETNLYVQVGTGTAARKVQIKGSFATETWYRITIKSLGNVIDASTGSQQAGFLVFINGQSAEIVDADKEYYGVPGNILATAKAYYDKGLLFTAIDTTSATLAKVGYQGIGAIDDVILTSTSPDFDMLVDVDFADINGAEVVSVTDSKGNVIPYAGAAIKVTPGALTVTLKAAPGYIFYDNGVKCYQMTTSATAALNGGEISINLSEAECVAAAVQVVDANEQTNYYAAAEISALTGLANGDTATILQSCEIQSEGGGTLYSFTPNTTISVAEGGIWNIFIANYEESGGELIDNVGLFAGKTVNVTFDDAIDVYNICSLYVEGDIAGDIFAVNDKGVIVINTDGVDTTLSGTITAANVEVANDVTLVENGKLITMDYTIESILDGDGSSVAAVAGPEEGWYTYALATPTPTETGFMVIIAGETEGEVYETLAAAVGAAPDGSTIKMLSDADVQESGLTLAAGKAVTLDLAGHTVTAANTADGHIQVNGGLTVTDTSDPSTGKIVSGATGTYGLIQLASAINDAPASFTLTAGSIESAYTYGIVLKGNGSTVTINGGTVKAYYMAIMNHGSKSKDTVITVDGGTVWSTNDYAIYGATAGTITIDSGVVQGAAGAVDVKAGTLDINGGEIAYIGGGDTGTGSDGTTGASNSVLYVKPLNGDAIVTLDGGTYTGAPVLTFAEVAGKTVTVTKAAALEIAAPAGYKWGANGALCAIDYVAQIGDVKYETLAAAVAAAQNGNTIKVIADCTVADVILVDKAVTLDATGKTVTCAAKYPFFVKGGDLTITDGTFTQNVVDGIILWAKDGGKITVNGGDFSAIPDGEIAYVSTADALIKIYGGKFVMADKADGSKGDVLNVAQTLGLKKADYIQVYGGSFSKDPAEGDDALGPTFVADGYASVKQDNGLWKVGAAIIATFKVDDAIVKAETNIVAFTPVAPTAPSKEGYTFTGWTPAVDEISASTEFVAQFDAILLTATFVDADGTTELYKDDKVAYNTTPVFKGETPTKTGYTFNGWTPTLAPITENKTYTATYTANTYNVTIAETENGTVETSVTNNIVAGTEVTITATPATDYAVDTIAVTNGDQEVTVADDKFTMPAGDVTVYVTFKSTAQGIIPGGDPVPVSGETEADALAEAAKLTITLTADQKSAGLTADDFCNKVRPAAAGGFEAYVEVAAVNAPVLKTEETDVKPIEVGATDFSATIKNAKPGLYYGFKAVDALGTAAEFAPVGAAATATAAGDLKITAPKGEGNARFYKLTVSITNIWAK